MRNAKCEMRNRGDAGNFDHVPRSTSRVPRDGYLFPGGLCYIALVGIGWSVRNLLNYKRILT